uniref:NADH-ubiquinone oxidoreductase chain 1 n=1 Tax=Columbicola columbae TaxID=128991 RepID=A0A6G7SK45_9NEOP|nr:NADH dehydrogenase subunit 1 [Columbicola columbae]
MENFFFIVKIILMIVLLLLSVAFLSLFERKLLGFSQTRKGPSMVGQFGLLQPFGDALKLISKVDSSPEKSNTSGFFLSPVFFFFFYLSIWLSSPMEYLSINFQTSGLFLIFWMSVAVYGLIFSGWYSISKFSTLGLCRAIAQSISFEIVLTFSLLFVFLVFGSVCLFKLSSSVCFFFFCLFFVIIFLTSLLAESNRIPFDLPESESELVGGYSVEYGSVSYTILFLGENLSLLFSSFLVVVFFIWIRSTLPRVRFDKVMTFCWLELMPVSLGLILFYVCLS